MIWQLRQLSNKFNSCLLLLLVRNSCIPVTFGLLHGKILTKIDIFSNLYQCFTILVIYFSALQLQSSEKDNMIELYVESYFSTLALFELLCYQLL